MPAPTGLIQQLDQHLHRRGLLKPGLRLLVACSGGADSVALLRLLHAVNRSQYWHWALIVGHVNHQLRGRESQRDEQFVRELAQSLGLPFQGAKLNLKGTCQRKSVSENTARDARYKALLVMAVRRRCDAIVLAHHADDQAETILMRLLRGAGVTGLAGINECELRGKIKIVRPLLPWSGEAIRAWLEQSGQTWREDLSNNDTRYFRNRIRHELLPVLETYQPRIRELLQRNARHDRAAADFIRDHARQLLRAARYRKGKLTVTLAENVIIQAPCAPAAIAMRMAIIDAGGDEGAIDTATLLAVLDKIKARTLRGKIQFAGAVSLAINNGRITIQQEGRRSGAPGRRI